MTDEPRPTREPRWLHFKATCRYLDLSPSTLSAKLIAGVGPKFHKSPGSRFRIFWTPDLDDWVMNSPERQLTQAERKRLAKLQEGGARGKRSALDDKQR
jgi:hypothetical protein